jgi:predicted O-linked N-acetylglucosamine transferase (SPINDLY family)
MLDHAAGLAVEGRLEEAEAMYRLVLEHDGDSPRALHGLGVVLHRLGDTAGGLELVQNALANQPDYTDAHVSQGIFLQRIGRLEEALHAFETAIRLEPRNPVIHNNRGNALQALGRADAAVASYREALLLKPDYAEARCNLAGQLSGIGLLDEAVTVLMYSDHDGDRPECVSIALGRIFLRQDRKKEAFDCFREAEKNGLPAPSLLLNEAEALLDVREFGAACRIMETLPAVGESAFAIERCKGKLLSSMGDVTESLNALCKAHTLNSHDIVTEENLIYLKHYVPDISQEEIFRQSLETGLLIELRYATRNEEKISRFKDPSRRLRIGFVSPDFHRHPVGYHAAPMFAGFRHEKILVACYHDSLTYDNITESIRQTSDLWRDVRCLSDVDLARIILHDEIDVLVDLAGYTAGNRLPLFSLRPAPVQVSWLGYWNTTGLKAMDYVISDPVTVIPRDEQFFSEKVVRLPHCRFCYKAPEYAPAVTSLPSPRKGFITFGSFNNVNKVNRDVVRLWSDVLDAIPRSHLVLKWHSLKDSMSEKRLSNWFRECGIDVGRIEFRSESPHPELLQEYSGIDISLDPFPFSGGVTSCESLWMGVPVITLPGSTPISRQTAAFLTVIGHRELIAGSKEEYVEIARRLCGEHEELENLRLKLRGDMASSPLCDGKSFAGDLEQLFLEIWDESVDSDSGYIAWVSRITEGPIEDALSLLPEQLVEKGLELASKGGLEAAVENLSRAVSIRPYVASWHHELANIYADLGRTEDALSQYNQAIELNRAYAEAFCSRGMLLHKCGRWQEAADSYEKALETRPGYAEALCNLGLLLSERCLISEPVALFRKALVENPDFIPAWINLGYFLPGAGDFKGAEDACRKAISLDPGNARARTNLALALQYDPDASRDEIFRVVRDMWVADDRTPWCEGSTHPLHDRGPGPIRIGLISPDFVRHPVGFFIEPFLRYHDRSRLLVQCYSDRKNGDDMTAKLHQWADGWRNTADMTDDQLIDAIGRDSLDILIDLTGHTGRNRLSLFARKPVAVQASWLGYWDSTGLPEIDFLLADDTMVPVGDEQWFSEQVIRLPHGRLCYAMPEYVPGVTSPPAVKNGYVTFGCFNNLAKVNQEVIALWSAILREVPQSRLLLKWETFADPEIRRRITELFSLHGIEQERLILRGVSVHQEMLAEYGDMDIALDPFPFNGALTTCEALMMGVPVVTLIGDRPAGRQTAAILSAASRVAGDGGKNSGHPVSDLCDLERFIAADSNGYRSIAVSLASDPDRLGSLRHILRQQLLASHLCDGKGFAEEMIYAIERICKEKTGHGNLHTPDAAVPGDPFVKDDPQGTCIEYYRANHLFAVGRAEEAISLYHKALAVNPGLKEAWNNLGILLAEQARFADAIECFETAVAIDPTFVEARNNLGKAYLGLEDLDAAVETFAAAVEQEPLLKESWNNLGIANAALNRKDEAVACFARALEIDSRYAEAHNNIGKILKDQGNNLDANIHFRAAIESDPEMAEAHANLALLLKDLSLREEAFFHVGRAIEIRPDFTAAHTNKGILLLSMGCVEESLASFRTALHIDPMSLEARSNILYTMGMLPEFTPADILREACIWGETLQRSTHPVTVPRAQPHGRIAIGYVSADFGRHPVGYHLLPILKHHNHEHFRIICYNNRISSDDLTDALRSRSDVWRDVARSDDVQLAGCIAQDAVDILVDLSGHTEGNRLSVFAMKPAPIQVSWLGFWQTTGLPQMDYHITDAVTLPAGEDRWFSEKILRMPQCRFCYEPPEYAPDVVLPPVQCLGAVTFGCFNNPAKIGAPVVALWARILQSVQGSRLVLKWETYSQKTVRDRFLELFAGYGVPPERIEFRGYSVHQEMLAEYGDIDIALDPFPFSGGMTSCEALWMGVPIVTLRGDRPAGRQTAALLHAIGCQDLVAGDGDEYHRIASGLACDIRRLAELRITLRNRMVESQLCDGEAFTQRLEELFCDMLRQHGLEDRVAEALQASGAHELPVNEPEDFMTYYRSALMLMEQNDFTEALPLLEKVLELSPDFAEAYREVGKIHLARGSADDAVANFMAAAALAPDLDGIGEYLGKAMLLSEENSE